MASAASLPVERPRGPGLASVLALLGGLSFLAARFLPVLQSGYPCPFRAATGLPCATCGMTHAFVAMAHGEVAGAVSASPLGALLAAVLWFLAVAVLLRPVLGLPRPRLSPGAARALALGALGAAAVNWAWMLWRAVGA